MQGITLATAEQQAATDDEHMFRELFEPSPEEEALSKERAARREPLRCQLAKLSKKSKHSKHGLRMLYAAGGAVPNRYRSSRGDGHLLQMSMAIWILVLP